MLVLTKSGPIRARAGHPARKSPIDRFIREACRLLAVSSHLTMYTVSTSTSTSSVSIYDLSFKQVVLNNIYVPCLRRPINDGL